MRENMLVTKCLLLLFVSYSLARDLSLHQILAGEGYEGIHEENQRSLRQIDDQDAMSSRKVDPFLLRHAMTGGPALTRFANLDLPNMMSTSNDLDESTIALNSPDDEEFEDALRTLEKREGNDPPKAEHKTRELAAGASDEKNRAPAPVSPGTLDQFDFVVGGFPKCGTTTLLKAFGANPETDMVPQEQCAIAAPSQADHLVVGRLASTMLDMSTVKAGSTWHKQGFKCPTAIYNYKSIVRLEKHSPNARIIIGIRHPIHMLQSFYNYRVTELYERGEVGEQMIPSFSDLMNDEAEPWRGVSIHAVRFEFFLQQLGKTALNRSQLQELAGFSKYGHELAVKPSNFTVFCYTVDQLEDNDDRRSGSFRSHLQQYLGLTTALAPFGHENKNHAVGGSGHPETIRICDDQFADVRKTALNYAKKTASWIRNDFLKSQDVFVANPEHFLESLQKWEIDPCHPDRGDDM